MMNLNGPDPAEKFAEAHLNMLKHGPMSPLGMGSAPTRTWSPSK